MSNVIVDLSATSGKKYQIIPLAEGIKQYIDRDYHVGKIPKILEQSWLIQVAANDKMYEEDERCMSFRLLRPATVYILHGNTFPLRPAWMHSYVDTQINLARPLEDDARNMSFRVYSRDFQPGVVELGGDLPKGFLTPPFRNSGGSGYCMYSVVMKPRE